MFSVVAKEYCENTDHTQDDRVIRPKPPLIFFTSFGMWVGSASSYYWYNDLGPTVSAFLLTGMLMATSAVAWGKRAFPPPLASPLLFLLIGLSLGIFAGMGTAVSHNRDIGVVYEEEGGSYAFEVVEDAQSGDFSDSCLAKTRLSNGETVLVRLDVENSEGLRYGTLLSASTRLEPPTENSFRYFWSQEVVARASLTTYILHERTDFIGICVRIRNAACDLFENTKTDGTSFLKAILFGERKDLAGSEFYHDVRVVGLAHIVAVSGSHLVIVSSFFSILLRRLGLRRSIVIGVQILFLLIYLVLTAFPVSAVRAGCMSCIAMTSFYVKRRSSSLNGLSVCIILMLALSPAVSLSVSFLLSALSTLGIIVFAAYFRSLSQKALRGIPRGIHESLSLTLAASLIIMPLSSALFSQVSLISPFVNIAAAVPFTVLCVFGLFSVCVSLAIPGLGSCLIDVLLFLSEAFCEFVSLAAVVPYASVPSSGEVIPACIGTVSATAFLWLWWPKAQARFVFGALGISAVLIFSLVAVVPHFADDEIIMLDVGQGDAFVIRSKGSAVLVDTGNRDYELLEGLAQHGIYRLDAVIITHADDDHCGSLSALRGVVEVERVCLARDSSLCGCPSCENLISSAGRLVGENDLVFMEVEDKMTVGNFSLEIIWPDEFKDEGGNADSLSFLLFYRAGEGASGGIRSSCWTALFCGDLEADELNSLIALGRVDDIDILKVGHHGSRKSFDEASLRELSPEIALISVGENNRYGHPADEILDALERAECETVRTDRGGDVVCKLSPERIEVVPVG